MQEFNAFLDAQSPAGLTVHQVSNGSEDSELIYPDQPSFLADGRRFIFKTSNGPVICDPDAGGALSPLFPDAPHREGKLSFDGRYFFFRRAGEKDLTIARLDLESRRSEDVFHAEGYLPESRVPVAKFNTSTVSSDNRRIASAAFLGDGQTPDAPFGILALDIDKSEIRPVAQDRYFTNTHLQYCRSTDPVASHDILLQMNHGSRTNELGKTVHDVPLSDSDGADLHVVADDGSKWRDLPFGRDGKEACIGHQVWRGQSKMVATVTLPQNDASFGWAQDSIQQVVAGWPAPADRAQPHRGALNPEARRVTLSQNFEKPRFCHLSCNASGLKFALDTFPIYDGNRAGMLIYTAHAPDETAPLNFRYILNSGVTFKMGSGYHAHPILSPDGTMLLFNSDITGTKQIYLVRV